MWKAWSHSKIIEIPDPEKKVPVGDADPPILFAIGFELDLCKKQKKSNCFLYQEATLLTSNDEGIPFQVQI